MKLWKCKKNLSNKNQLTLNQLNQKLNPLRDSYIKWVLKELILFNSKKIKNSVDIFFKQNENIDFSYKKINKQLNQVLIKKYPVNYITNSISFFGLDFLIKKGVFIPRSETEYILEWVFKMQLLKDKKYILDLCSGCGVLANVIAYKLRKLNDIKIYGIEINKKAIKVANINKQKYNLKTEFIKSDIFSLDQLHYQKADFIICNPPYVANHDLDVDISIKYEPKNAIYAQNNGIYFYQMFFEKIYPLLKSECVIIFEIGWKQRNELTNLLNKNQITNFAFLKDINKNDRILKMIKI